MLTPEIRSTGRNAAMPAPALVPICTESVWFVVRGYLHTLEHLAGQAEEVGDAEDLYLELVHLTEVVRLLWCLTRKDVAVCSCEHQS